MKLTNITAFVTGSNRGLGQALVDELLARGATRVYAASRRPAPKHADSRVTPVLLDVTDPVAAEAAARAATGVQLLVNNAGSLASMSALTASDQELAHDFAVNVHGVRNVARAFVPTLASPAAIVNVLSVVAMASMPALGGYSASKAAAWSLTQSLRGELASRGIRVHAVFPGPIDTDMIRSFQMPKTSPRDVARAILDGVIADQDDIAPDVMSSDALATFQRDPRELARRFAG